MKIGIIRLNVGDFGKIDTYNVQEIGLSNQIMECGHQADVFYLYKDVEVVTDDTKYPFVHYFPHKSFIIHGIFDVKLLESYNLDALIVFADNQIWQKNVINWCYEAGIPCVCYWGTVLSTTKRWKQQLYTWLIYKKNFRSYFKSINIAKNQKVMDEMRQLKIPAHEVIHVGLDINIMEHRNLADEMNRNQLDIPTDAKVMLFIGRLARDKHPLMAVRILQEMIKDDPSYYLIIIGDGVMNEKLANAIQDSGVSDKIIWKKSVEYKEMYKYFLNCDCMINLNPVEIFGMAMLESMYYGRPVVARYAAGPAEFIIDGQTGYICYTDSIEEWKQKIHLAMQKDLLLIDRAKKLVQENYLWNHNAKQFLNILEETFMKKESIKNEDLSTKKGGSKKLKNTIY